jgi:hypothetical protein
MFRASRCEITRRPHVNVKTVQRFDFVMDAVGIVRHFFLKFGLDLFFTDSSEVRKNVYAH